MAVQIRSARVEDAADMGRILVAAWRSTYRGIVPDDYLDSLNAEHRARIWRDAIARSQEGTSGSWILVAEDADHGLVGYAVCGPVREGVRHYDGELYAIYILEKHQRKGIGKKLVQEAARRLLQGGFKSMLVWVLAANPNRKFYESLGGRRLCCKMITIGGAELEEWAYGWEDLSRLAAGDGP